MEPIILTGVVQTDGSVQVKETVNLPPGTEIKLFTETLSQSAGLEEVKKRLAEMEQYELTPEEEARYHAAYAKLDTIQGDFSDLPEDYIDELDHYLYGTPKRSEDTDNA